MTENGEIGGSHACELTTETVSGFQDYQCHYPKGLGYQILRSARKIKWLNQTFFVFISITPLAINNTYTGGQLQWTNLISD